MTEKDFTITKLGKCIRQSPIKYSRAHAQKDVRFIDDNLKILYNNSFSSVNDELNHPEKVLLEKAGPREHIYFDPEMVHAGIVTCGGLCPGLNDVIRSVVRSLWYLYGVRKISGITYGYKGFLPEYGYPAKELNPDVVDQIQETGGSILGTSRGGADIPRIVDALEKKKLNILFTIGGDGTQRGALAISEEAARRGLDISIIGIPKTIDNDISYVSKSFGFDTAVEKAVDAVRTAHTEAKSVHNGIGLVKIMGRESGFITAHTTLAISNVNFTLVPEVDFSLDGENGFLRKLEERLAEKNHAVILVAEGAGQKLMAESALKDESGNKKLEDIGLFLKEQITEYLLSRKVNFTMKYVDPGYMIRASVAASIDSIYCARLGAHAVHAAMSGRTAMLISQWNNAFVHIPISMAVSKRNLIDPDGSLWRDVLESTQQPDDMY
ncbi:ATP-dependent 6-phosphofructokinase [Spirochaeta isovalerica]|uniref:ATP-dependent 6-phosphofructokinase n=1 Tax=Spirochaeta isovalerica TaxID=150 RepID=A0A841REB1_9SPIO|nr:ATP-dependent 6-phosphofructokinase [Spirochaeta isovalerica]MBB6481340.1 6-phosphofructokinase 1 [Spirochaeta isovalerica]